MNETACNVLETYNTSGRSPHDDFEKMVVSGSDFAFSFFFFFFLLDLAFDVTADFLPCFDFFVGFEVRFVFLDLATVFRRFLDLRF